MERARVTLRVGLVLVGAMLAAACGDGTPADPDVVGPILASISPLSAHPLESPVVVTLTGTHLEDGEVEGPPHVFLEVIHQSDTRIRLRAGFRGGPPGPAWVKVRTNSGTDSLALEIQPLAPADTLLETRALWVSRFEYATPSDVSEIMAKAGGVGFNLVYFQVRGRADAFYHSAHEPWAANLTGTLGQDPGWDPLGLAVEEGAALGIEVHAWINAFTGWAGSTPPPTSDPPHAFLEHPDWVMVDASGTPMPYASGSRWMSPGHPGVRTRLARVAADIARNYEVGGVHLDFIRYPGTDYSYDVPSLAAFDSVRSVEPGVDFDELRRRFVTWAVQEVRDSLDSTAPGTDLSAAVWGIYKNNHHWSGVTTGYETIFQDPRRWDQLGIVDALAPMVYWEIKPDYGERLDFAYLADDHATGIEAPVFVGMLVEEMNGPDLAQHIERARMSSAEGVAVFSYTGLENARLWPALRDWAFYWPARRVE